jgi:hypothetical protein
VPPPAVAVVLELLFQVKGGLAGEVRRIRQRGQAGLAVTDGAGCRLGAPGLGIGRGSRARESPEDGCRDERSSPQVYSPV